MRFDNMGNRENKRRAVRTLLLGGAKMTAIELNNACNTGDARKCISVLRQQGMRILDEVIDENGTKLYWYGGNDGQDE